MNKEVENKIKLLKLIRYRVENAYDCFICNASESIARLHHPDLKQADIQIRSYIREALNVGRIHKGICTLDDWIMIHQPKSEYLIDVKSARLMWIDWMINCYLEDNKE